MGYFLLTIPECKNFICLLRYLMYLGKSLKICIQLSGLNANFMPSEAYINWGTIYKKNNKTLQMLNEVEPYEHNHRTVFRALEEVLTSEQQ